MTAPHVAIIVGQVARRLSSTPTIDAAQALDALAGLGRLERELLARLELAAPREVAA